MHPYDIEYMHSEWPASHWELLSIIGLATYSEFLLQNRYVLNADNYLGLKQHLNRTTCQVCSCWLGDPYFNCYQSIKCLTIKKRKKKKKKKRIHQMFRSMLYQQSVLVLGPDLTFIMMDAFPLHLVFSPPLLLRVVY